YLRSKVAQVFCAGPLQDDAGSAIGSLIIMDFASRAEAEAFAAGDPNAKAGLFSTVTVTRWAKALPAD
ncbi:MAG: YciI family protein, partial [Rhodospirillales bacterium]